MEKLYEKAGKMIDNANSILVVSHRSPDADTLGASSCLKSLFLKLGKRTVLACVDKPKPQYSYLPYINDFVQDFNIADYNLMIVVDAGASYMTDFHKKYSNFLKPGIPIINIDHHSSNDNYGDLNIVDPFSASTTVILYKMITFLKYPIDDKMATCLLSGIYGDTGSFMHSNAQYEVFEISSKLLEKGAKIADITKALFKNCSINTLKLWGKVLEKASVTDDKIVISVVKEEDYNDVGADPEQLSGVVDYLNMVPDSKFAVLINEDRNGNVKGSFRTRNNEIDLSRIAAVFGGGGHPKASGFSIPGKLEEEIRYNIVSDDLSKKSLEF